MKYKYDDSKPTVKMYIFGKHQGEKNASSDFFLYNNSSSTAQHGVSGTLPKTKHEQSVRKR